MLKACIPILALNDPPSAVPIFNVAWSESNAKVLTPATATVLTESINPKVFTVNFGTNDALP